MAAGGAGRWRTAASAQKADVSQKPDLKLGTQHGDSDDILKVMAAFGVNHICAVAPRHDGHEDWSLDALSRKREHIESFGLMADGLRLLYPTPIATSEIKGVMLGKSPERDREIDQICERIRLASKTGFPMLTYNLSILGVVRTASTPAVRRRSRTVLVTFRR